MRARVALDARDGYRWLVERTRAMTDSDSLSPCINVCQLDAEDMCIGCGRLIGEIAAWSRMSLDERRAVCEAAAQRLRSRSSGTDAPQV
jgi:predicted Fe-S protein YdhL (DUF1289 family)